MKKTRIPVDLSSVTTYPLKERINKVSVHDFARLPESEADISAFLAESAENSQRIRFLSTR